MNTQNTNNAKNTQNTNNAQSFKAEIIPAKDVNVLPVMDTQTIINALAKVEEVGDKAKFFKCLLINTMIKYHGKDGKKAMIERFGYTNDTINSYSLIADKFLHYELPQKKGLNENGRDCIVTDDTALVTNITQCNGKIRGLKDKNGLAISFTVMYTVRNLTDKEIDALIQSGKLNYLTTQKTAQELCKEFKKNNTKSKDGKGDSTDTDKPIKLSAMKKDSERFDMMIKIMNTLSDGIKASDDFDTLAEILEKFKTATVEAEKANDKKSTATETVDTVEEYGLDSVSDVQ